MLSHPSLWKLADHYEVSLLDQLASKAKPSVMWVTFHPDLTPYQSSHYYLSNEMKEKRKVACGSTTGWSVLHHYNTEILLGPYPHLTSS